MPAPVWEPSALQLGVTGVFGFLHTVTGLLALLLETDMLFGTLLETDTFKVPALRSHRGDLVCLPSWPEAQRSWCCAQCSRVGCAPNDNQRPVLVRTDDLCVSAIELPCMADLLT